jgi:hypothetical protein
MRLSKFSKQENAMTSHAFHRVLAAPNSYCGINLIERHAVGHWGVLSACGLTLRA